MAGTKIVVSVVAGTAALGAGLGLAGLASADPTATPSASPPSSASATANPDGDRHGGGFGRHGGSGAHAAELAEKLGVSEAKVTEALEAIRAERQSERAAALKTRLDAAVTDGTLTQAEADAVTKAVEKGVIGGGR